MENFQKSNIINKYAKLEGEKLKKENYESKDLFDKINTLELVGNKDKLTPNDYNLLESYSNDDNYEIRSKVAEILVSYKDLEAERILLKLLSDNDDLVRTNASDSLCNYDSPEVIKELMKRVLSDRSNLVRGNSIMSLSDIIVRLNYKLDFYKKFFTNALKSENDDWVKIHIYRALYLLGDTVYLDLIINELNNDSYRNRCAIVNILEELISDNNYEIIKKVLMQRLNMEDSFAVRDTIENLIGRI